MGHRSITVHEQLTRCGSHTCRVTWNLPATLSQCAPPIRQRITGRTGPGGKSRGAPRGVTIRDDNLARPLRRRAARRDRVIGLRIHFRGRIGNF